MQHLWNLCGGGIFHCDKGDCKKDGSKFTERVNKGNTSPHNI